MKQAATEDQQTTRRDQQTARRDQQTVNHEVESAARVRVPSCGVVSTAHPQLSEHRALPRSNSVTQGLTADDEYDAVRAAAGDSVMIARRSA